MDNPNLIAGFKRKPSGRPFVKKDKEQKFKDEKSNPTKYRKLNDKSNNEEVEKVTLQSDDDKFPFESNQKDDSESEMHFQMPKESIGHLQPLYDEIQDKIDSKKENSSKELKSSECELIDCLEFNKGQNSLKIKFFKRSNRMFRIQVFLNDKYEIRPVTYTGSATGYTFWNMLKGALK